jgi:hypothetical protein
MSGKSEYPGPPIKIPGQDPELVISNRITKTSGACAGISVRQPLSDAPRSDVVGIAHQHQLFTNISFSGE